tara:strand:- start:6014 stop:6559 length:546 start_codon:yes stop_codon:yes gene_type:complete
MVEETKGETDYLHNSEMEEIYSNDQEEIYSNDQEEISEQEEEEEEEETDDENTEEYEKHFQKFKNNMQINSLSNYHPQIIYNTQEEVSELCKIKKDKNGFDPNHKTTPILTKYEYTRIIGQRAKQINDGSSPFIKVSDNILDGYLIAKLEFEEKKIPFIIRRPIPGGKFEYWKLKDLDYLR